MRIDKKHSNLQLAPFYQWKVSCYCVDHHGWGQESKIRFYFLNIHQKTSLHVSFYFLQRAIFVYLTLKQWFWTILSRLRILLLDFNTVFASNALNCYFQQHKLSKDGHWGLGESSCWISYSLQDLFCPTCKSEIYKLPVAWNEAFDWGLKSRAMKQILFLVAEYI